MMLRLQTVTAGFGTRWLHFITPPRQFMTLLRTFTIFCTLLRSSAFFLCFSRAFPCLLPDLPISGALLRVIAFFCTFSRFFARCRALLLFFCAFLRFFARYRALSRFFAFFCAFSAHLFLPKPVALSLAIRCAFLRGVGPATQSSLN